MNKTIRINAIVAAILLMIGAFFKISHWPGANILIVLGAADGIVLFIMILSAYLGKMTSGFDQFNGIFASLTLIVAFLAFMFKMNHWPGAGILIWIADIAILFSGAFFLINGAQEKDAYKSSLKIITGFFIIFLALVIIFAG